MEERTAKDVVPVSQELISPVRTQLTKFLHISVGFPTFAVFIFLSSSKLWKEGDIFYALTIEFLRLSQPL
jgi:hypothetical protein